MKKIGSGDGIGASRRAGTPTPLVFSFRLTKHPGVESEWNRGKEFQLPEIRLNGNKIANSKSLGIAADDNCKATLEWEVIHSSPDRRSDLSLFSYRRAAVQVGVEKPAANDTVFVAVWKNARAVRSKPREFTGAIGRSENQLLEVPDCPVGRGGSGSP